MFTWSDYTTLLQCVPLLELRPVTPPQLHVRLVGEVSRAGFRERDTNDGVVMERERAPATRGREAVLRAQQKGEEDERCRQRGSHLVRTRQAGAPPSNVIYIRNSPIPDPYR